MSSLTPVCKQSHSLHRSISAVVLHVNMHDDIDMRVVPKGCRDGEHMYIKFPPCVRSFDVPLSPLRLSMLKVG